MFSGLTIFFPTLANVLNAQQDTSVITVRGTVSSEANQETLIGANILEKGTSNGAITDWEGKYSITVPPDAVLIVSYIGYDKLEIPVEGRAILDIQLSETGQLLDEVLITGYRTEIRANVASSISTVRAEDIEKLPVLGFDQSLQGQVPGLQVTQTTGAPGDAIAVRIRGAGTLGNNNPLYIIDGVPTTGNVNMFSTSDIESVQVLKDGAAAAIYGARAANGVIVITTKKGQSGKPKFSFQSYYGFQDAVNLPELLNSREYLEIRNEAIKNANTLRDLPRQLDTFNLAILDTLPDVNWLDEVFRRAPIQRYMLSATGGSGNSSYYIAGEYLNQEGVFKGQGFEKYLLRFNGEIKGDWLTIGNNLSFSFTDQKAINSSGDGAGPGNELSGIRYTLIAAPVFPIRRPDGEY
ncbi:MAG TPA: SusC/RagA family TonB-linked outer membrane protein, partial [Saprospiraceae bacterium]|nr:SusC/RagA family TonB-linked outer membrane protein [Saprospiraceae bacterium]